MIRQINILLWMAVCLVVASCDKDVHNDETPGGLIVGLTWQDTDDANTHIDQLRLWIFDADNGTLVKESTFDDPMQLAYTRYRLDKGKYKVVVSANLLEPFALAGGDGTTLNYSDMLIELTQPSSSPKHAFWGVADVDIKDVNITNIAIVALGRVMAEVSITIDGVPEGAVLNGKVLNATNGIYPCHTNEAQGYGVPTSGVVAVDLPSTQAQATTLATEVFRLMPTVSGQSTTRMSLTLSTPNGVVRQYSIKAPRMNIAGKYQIKLNYSEMQPYMYLAPVTISNWLEGWVYTGEVFDPDTNN